MKSPRICRGRLTAATLTALCVLTLQSSALPKTVQVREKKKVFTEEDERVEQIPGKWRLIYNLDMQQASDYSVPVIVSEITTSTGQGKYAGRMKVTEAKLQNRVQKTTRSVQLRWAIVMHEDPNTILLEGVMPPLEIHLEANSVPLLVDIPHIYFNKIVRPLLKNGEINGVFQLIVGVQEVHFADGTTWQRTQQSAFLRASFNRPAFARRPRPLKPKIPFDLSPWLQPQPSPTADCGEQPRLTTSAVLFTAFQITDPPCREKQACGDDPVTGKKICVPSAGTFL
jgi:hypothetical protein